MAKIYFRYGAMNSSKTANALMVAYNYSERGQKALLVKPDTDDRISCEPLISSRIGISLPAILLSAFLKMTAEELKPYACVIIDEAQFLTAADVDRLVMIADDLNIPVICYGLRADFRGQLFEGSRCLLTVADTIEEMKTVCWCGKKATCNARVSASGEMVAEGPQVLLGGNERYTSLCRKHFNLRQPYPPKEGQSDE
ncbi:MAG TPA: thymidine kinase [Peptococcaceae bacterium]|nr:thymidine kinase [Peptococcaceae bacterium]